MFPDASTQLFLPAIIPPQSSPSALFLSGHLVPLVCVISCWKAVSPQIYLAKYFPPIKAELQVHLVPEASPNILVKISANSCFI